MVSALPEVEIRNGSGTKKGMRSSVKGEEVLPEGATSELGSEE